MIDFAIVSRSDALKGDFPLRFNCALKVKQQSCTQIIMTSSEYVSDIVLIVSNLVDVRSVKIVHVEDFDDEL